MHTKYMGMGENQIFSERDARIAVYHYNAMFQALPQDGSKERWS